MDQLKDLDKRLKEMTNDLIQAYYHELMNDEELTRYKSGRGAITMCSLVFAPIVPIFLIGLLRPSSFHFVP